MTKPKTTVLELKGKEPDGIINIYIYYFHKIFFNAFALNDPFQSRSVKKVFKETSGLENRGYTLYI